MFSTRAGLGLCFSAATAGLLTALPALAQDCEGEIRAQMSQVRSAAARPTPPAGFDYATELAGDITAGTQASIRVIATQGTCAAAGRRVQLQARDAGTQSFVTRRTGTTDSRGQVLFQVGPAVNTVLQALVGEDQPTATSPLTIRVRAAVSGQHNAAPDCRVRSSGSTFPRKPHHPVDIQRRVMTNGREAGYTTIGTLLTDSRGHYNGLTPVACDARLALVSTVRASGRNVAGRTLFVDLDVRSG